MHPSLNPGMHYGTPLLAPAYGTKRHCPLANDGELHHNASRLHAARCRACTVLQQDRASSPVFASLCRLLPKPVQPSAPHVLLSK